MQDEQQLFFSGVGRRVGLEVGILAGTLTTCQVSAVSIITEKVWKVRVQG